LRLRGLQQHAIFADGFREARKGRAPNFADGKRGRNFAVGISWKFLQMDFADGFLGLTSPDVTHFFHRS
jgi:hypothetical protein